MGDLTVKPVLVPTSVILKSSVASCLQFVHFCFPATHSAVPSLSTLPPSHPPCSPISVHPSAPTFSTAPLPAHPPCCPNHPPICSHLKHPAAPTPPTTLIPNHPPYFSATPQLSDSAAPKQAMCAKRKMRRKLKESPVSLVPQPCRWSKPELDTKTVHTSLHGGHKGQYMVGTKDSTWRTQRTVHGGPKGWYMVNSKDSTWQTQMIIHDG